MLECLTYWIDLKGERQAPPWREFNILELPIRAIPFVSIVDISISPIEFKYRFWGTGHVAAKKIERTGQTISGQDQKHSEPAAKEFIKVMDAFAPLAFKRNLEFPPPKPPITQLSLCMPLSSDGTSVDHILSVCDWWSFRDQWPAYHESVKAQRSALGNA